MDLILSGIHGIKGRLKKIEHSPFAMQMMGEIGMFLMGAIKKRTIQGEDVNGIDFKPYNPLYAKSRKDDGYQTAFVDLTRTGSMLASMNSDATSKSVEISFMNTKDPDGGSNPDKAFFLNEKREFFGISVTETKVIMDIVDATYQKIMDEANKESKYVKRDII